MRQAKKLICAKRTSYKLAVWLYSDNDCTINNLDYDLFCFPAFQCLTQLSRALFSLPPEKLVEFFPSRVFLSLFTESRQSLEKHFCTIDSTRKLWKNRRSRRRNKFDYAEWSLCSKLPRSLSQQTVHDPAFLLTRKNSFCIPESMHLARVCCLRNRDIPKGWRRDVAHNWRCSRNSSTSVAGSRHTLNKVVKWMITWGGCTYTRVCLSAILISHVNYQKTTSGTSPTIKPQKFLLYLLLITSQAWVVEFKLL